MTVIGLLYPAFLGSLIYNPIETAFKHYQNSETRDVPSFASEGHLDELFLLAALIVHFVFDFVYVTDEDPEAGYDWLMFIADIAIVTMLFLSIQYVLRFSGPQSAGAPVWLILLGTKLAAFIWELADARHHDWESDKDGAVVIDLAFCYVYAFGMLCFHGIPWLLGAIVAIDAAAYVIYDKFYKCRVTTRAG